MLMRMADQQYVVLYTSQKTKKAKTWHDGTLKLPLSGTKAVLYDDKKSKLDCMHLRPDEVIPGEQLESDRYLILVEELLTCADTTPTNTTSQSTLPRYVTQTSTKTSQLVPNHLHKRPLRTGLKRKNTGFNPPRMVKPKPDVNDDPVMGDPVSHVVTPNLTSNHTSDRLPVHPPQRPDISSLYGTSKQSAVSSTVCVNNQYDALQQRIGTPDIQVNKEEKPRSPWSTYGAFNSKPSLNQINNGDVYNNDKKNASSEMFSGDAHAYNSTLTMVKGSNSSSLTSFKNSTHGNVEIKEVQNSTHRTEVPSNDSSLQGKRTASQIMALLKSKSALNVCGENKNETKVHPITHVGSLSNCVSGVSHDVHGSLTGPNIPKPSYLKQMASLQHALVNKPFSNGFVQIPACEQEQGRTETICMKQQAASPERNREQRKFNSVALQETDLQTVSDQRTLNTEQSQDSDHLSNFEEISVCEQVSQSVPCIQNSINKRGKEMADKKVINLDYEQIACDRNTELHISLEASSNVDMIESTITLQHESMCEKEETSCFHEELDNDEEGMEQTVEGHFAISFSPLSHVSDSDTEVSPAESAATSRIPSLDGDNPGESKTDSGSVKSIEFENEKNLKGSKEILPNKTVSTECSYSDELLDSVSRCEKEKIVTNGTRNLKNTQQNKLTFLTNPGSGELCDSSKYKCNSEFNPNTSIDYLDCLNFSQDSFTVQSTVSQNTIDEITCTKLQKSKTYIENPGCKDVRLTDNIDTTHNMTGSLPFSDVECVEGSQISRPSSQQAHCASGNQYNQKKIESQFTTSLQTNTHDDDSESVKCSQISRPSSQQTHCAAGNHDRVKRKEATSLQTSTHDDDSDNVGCDMTGQSGDDFGQESVLHGFDNEEKVPVSSVDRYFTSPLIEDMDTITPSPLRLSNNSNVQNSPTSIVSNDHEHTDECSPSSFTGKNVFLTDHRENRGYGICKNNSETPDTIQHNGQECESNTADSNETDFVQNKDLGMIYKRKPYSSFIDNLPQNNPSNSHTVLGRIASGTTGGTFVDHPKVFRGTEVQQECPPPPANDLPHPSEVFGHKSRIKTDCNKEDLTSVVGKKLDNYQMTGTITGGGARRTSCVSDLLSAQYIRTPKIMVPESDHLSNQCNKTLSSLSQRLTVEGITGTSSSPLQQTSLPVPYDDDSSMYIDWNDGKPRFTNTRDVITMDTDLQVKRSPLQHVPTFMCSQESPDICQQVPSYKHDYADKPSCLSSFKETQIPGKVSSKQSSFRCETTDEGYCTSLISQRDNFNSAERNDNKCPNINREKKCRKAVKCKPFEDIITHTSFNSYYFSPSKTPNVDKPVDRDHSQMYKTSADMDVELSGMDDETSKGDKPCHDQLNPDMDEKTYEMDTDSVCTTDVGDESAFNSQDLDAVDNVKCNSNSVYCKSDDFDVKKNNISNKTNNSSLTQFKNSINVPKQTVLNSNMLKSLQHSSDRKFMNQQEVPESTRRTAILHKSNQVLSRGSNTMVSGVSKWGKYMPMDEDDDFDSLLNQSLEIGTPKLESRTDSSEHNVLVSGYSVNTPTGHLCDDNRFTTGDVKLENCEQNDKKSEYLNYNMSSKQKSVESCVKIGKTPRLRHIEKEDYDFSNVHFTPDTDSALALLRTCVPSNVTQNKNLYDEQRTNENVVNNRQYSAGNRNWNSFTNKKVHPVEYSPRNMHDTQMSLHDTEMSVNNVRDSTKSVIHMDKRRQFASPVILDCFHILPSSQRNIAGELQFPSQNEVEKNPVPCRQVTIPVPFPSVAVYKNVLTAALKEYLNIILFELAKRYHHVLAKMDTTGYSSAHSSDRKSDSVNQNPCCNCGAPSKIIQVKKDGPNKGRFFYACNAARATQCKFFQWADQSNSNKVRGLAQDSKIKLSDSGSITTFFRSQHITYYADCSFLKKSMENIMSHFKRNVPEWVKKRSGYGQDSISQKKMYILLSKKDASSYYSKDDLWIISQQLCFDPSCTFLAKSTYYGPNSSNEVEIQPISGFSTSNWTNQSRCHCIHVGNISSELSYLQNIQDNLHPVSLPILPHLLNRASDVHRTTQNKGFKAPLQQPISKCNLYAPDNLICDLANDFIETYHLNLDQSEALKGVSEMFSQGRQSDTDPIILIHGVFGAGKSYLLSVIVLFLVKVFELNASYTPRVPYDWKILISSTTNVAVDRILNGLLQLGFEDFIRVGSIKKISKPVLPYSVHATGTDSQELKDLQEMLRSGECTPTEKHHIRQSIEKHKLGENKKKLSKVKVVGVTCAASAFSCLDSLTFPVVLLDESSQMTEPASLIPIAKFGCQKLMLVGDPKQLDPAIQGAESAHDNGLEQTLFDRLTKMGYEPTVLRTQYRCHPLISRIANTLFYNGTLIDGIHEEDRMPLLSEFPTLCFYDVINGIESSDSANSYYNQEEADFVLYLIQVLVCSGVEPSDIGVITLYKSQMYKINTAVGLSGNNLHKELKSILVSTVDAFQGGERDVIILSCVRTNNVGFIDNEKRTNVALTRAKNHLLIVGHQQNLSRNKLWGSVIQLCKDCPGGIEQSSVTRRRLQHLIDRASRESSDDVPSSTTQRKKQKRTKSYRKSSQVLQNSSSPPMSLSDSNSPQIEIVICDGISSGSSEDKLSMSGIVKEKKKKLRVIDPSLLDSDKENSSDEELPTFDI